MDTQPKPTNLEMGDVDYRTPSQSPFPVFVMCQPMFVDNKIANNAWMKALKGKDKEIDKERFMGEFFNFYKILSSDAMVYLLPPTRGLQDQVYVNCFAYLPHLKDRDEIVLSNFVGEGRAGEETVAGRFLQTMGYHCVKPIFKFEGEPELKYLRDNIYLGGYGIRTDIRALKWIEQEYDANIITLKEKDEHLYHLDCSLFVLDETNVICCTELFESSEIKAIEKVATIHSVTNKDCHENACNNVRVGDLIVTSSSLQFMQKRDPEYKSEWKKNERLQEICDKMGIEILFLEMSEAAKSGAALSCFVGHLNYRY